MEAFRALAVMFACAMAVPTVKLGWTFFTALEEDLKNNPRKWDLLEKRVGKLEEEMKKMNRV